MWERERITDDLILSNTAGLNAMANDFYNIAQWHMQNIEDRQKAEDIMFALIKYIDAAHAIPPLRGNTAWFDYTLAALVELAAPNAGLSRSSSEALAYFEAGIADYKRSLFEDDEFED